MGDPLFRLATRVTSRTRATAWGIAFACMVLVGALSLMDGLRNGVDSVTGRLELGPTVYASADDLLESQIEPDDLAAIAFDYEALRLHVGLLEVNGLALEVVVASWSVHTGGDPVGVTEFPARSNETALDAGLRERIEAESGRRVEATGNLTLPLLNHTLTDLPLVGPLPSRPAIAPDTWAWVRAELLVAMNFSVGGLIQAIVTPEPIDSAFAASLGLRRIDVVGAVGFARGSVEEASQALAALALIVAVVIGLLVYHGMSLEVHQRVAEIRAMRSLGASPGTLAAVYEGQALALAAFGATMGSALGILVAHGIVSFAPFVGLPNLVILTPPIGPVALAYGISLVASAVGGFVPSRRVARHVRRSGEARPS